jgi:hypothetical protein
MEKAGRTVYRDPIHSFWNLALTADFFALVAQNKAYSE